MKNYALVRKTFPQTRFSSRKPYLFVVLQPTFDERMARWKQTYELLAIVEAVDKKAVLQFANANYPGERLELSEVY